MPNDFVLRVTNVRLLRGDKLVDADLWVVGGKVVDPEARFWTASNESDYAPGRVVDGHGGIVAPGFIEVQINGAYGFDFSSPSITDEQIELVAHNLLAAGVTAFCPTIVSSRPERYRVVMKTFHRVIANLEKKRLQNQHLTTNNDASAKILGLHLEGPFISPDRNGAHEKQVLQIPTNGISSLIECYGDSLDDVAIVTLAPELDGAMRTIRELRERGIVASAGHSVANIEVAMEAVENGVNMLTHIFNAMAPFHQRDPGLIGLLGLVNDKRPYYGMILDGVHAHPCSTRVIERCHPDGLILVTDAIAGMGLAPGTYDLAGQVMEVKEDAAYVAGTNTLAGSIVTIDACIRQLREYTGCTIEQALLSASTHPARALGAKASHKGSLAFGADADFVLLDDSLHVVQTYMDGQLVYERK
ncbi:putative N-acetylglucosamine-6-phosphate deacetylase [Phytophthora boehmeriae]|uniref:N-acetylglucosamine-6-phosphate deacetylase n=1 Tax=Phytophthora boehmeriae TaxID=109152 RepID=A0A8T1WLU3_9STRA|nr:putative N-acetylglucosamine-6-phosphate deacetylase [Phytophthora boehmeriae]